MAIEPQIPATVISNQKAHTIQSESQNMLKSDEDGHASFAQETDQVEKSNQS